MFVIELHTSNPNVRLIEPNVERDALLGVEWLDDPHGRETLRLMGVPDKDNHVSTLEKETKRVQDFLDREDQLNWMIEIEGRVIGSIWVDLEPTSTLKAPSIHIMIGDPGARGKGGGKATLQAVVDWLFDEKDYPEIYSRYLAFNFASAALLANSGFKLLGDPYTDADGLRWQNVAIKK